MLDDPVIFWALYAYSKQQKVNEYTHVASTTGTFFI
jgi:hypothetical protein